MKSIWSMIKPKAGAFFLLAISLSLSAQSDPWQAWDADVIRTLNTAADVKYLNEEEKKLILFMNMARYDGQLFSETFLKSVDS